MICSIAVLIFSTALFIFYVQTLCEKVLRREFSRAYSEDVLDSIYLEFPRVRQASSANLPVSYSQIQLALKCDYSTLTFLVKNGNPNQPHFSFQEKFLMIYFRTLLLMLPIRYAFHIREKQAVLTLTDILRHFANLVGERVSAVNTPGMAVDPQAL